VPLKLFDSHTHESVEFIPLREGHVSMYVCGPTVQSSPHVGHLRSALVYDLWSRWFSYRGLQVTLVRNVTDIDDKILEASAVSGEEWWALAERIEREFHQVADALHIAHPAREPRATGDISAMVTLVQELLDAGHAYVAEGASGDVYFDVSSWPQYGELTNQKVENLQSPGGGTAKRHPEDFALWKGHKPSEPDSAAWPAPWGAGRPGWHLECTAMATRYLGGAFDIHGGGMDLRFPHHENEQAQAHAAGRPYATHWLHNALVLSGGQKMSKSLGNGVPAADLLRSARAIVLRYALASAHYRSELDLHDGFLQEAATAFGRIESFLLRAGTDGIDLASELPGAGVVPAAFATAMDDDLGIPEALAVLHDVVRAGNHAADSGLTEPYTDAARAVRAMVGVLGIDPLDEQWQGEQASPGVLDSLMENLIALRATARAEGNFALSDALRDTVDDSGIDIKDDPSNSTWSIRG